MLLSTEGHSYQFDANRIPDMGCNKGGQTLFSANSLTLIQLGCETERLWNSSIVTQLNYDNSMPKKQLGWGGLGKAAWVYSFGVTAPLHQLGYYSPSSDVTPPAGGTQSLMEPESVLQWGKGKAGLYSVCLSTWLVCSHADDDPKSSKLDWSKKHCPAGSEWNCSNWSVDMKMRI